jgi:hypothetical protein
MLTGEKRYRIFKPIFGEAILILQVEDAFDYGDNDDIMPSMRRGRKWRDARVEDLTTTKDESE